MGFVHYTAGFDELDGVEGAAAAVALVASGVLDEEHMSDKARIETRYILRNCNEDKFPRRNDLLGIFGIELVGERAEG